MKIQPKELAISGGGVKGFACLGVLLEMDLSNLKKISGTSIGSIIAVLILIKKDINEIIDIVFDIPFYNIGKKNYIKIIKKLSILEENELYDILDKLFEEITDFTLQDLFEKTKIDLYITTTNISEETVVYLNYKTHPDLNVIHALKMSSAIPLLFPPVLYDGDYYVDGAVIDNFPTSVLSNDAWGITTRHIHNNLHNGKLGLYSYVLKLINIRYENSKNNVYNIKNVINVDINNIETTDFDLDDDKKLILIQKGRKAVVNYKHIHLKKNSN